MKIILAIDSFKGCLSSKEAEAITEAAIRKLLPHIEIDSIPIADGGEGTLSIITETAKGTYRSIEAHNPCMQLITTQYGISNYTKTAFIEMASISGLPLLEEKQRNPMKTTTFGTGELIKDALEKGCRQFVIGIGGSATNDGGTGMLQALGYHFLDKDGKRLGQGGEILTRIASIDENLAHPLLKQARFIVACDVRNPFYGPEGATQIYARQKGANDEMIAELEKGMISFAQIIRAHTGKDIAFIPGSGAAGGIGGSLLAFLNAELKSGADLLLDTCNFEERITGADLIITGEGKIDQQSLMGKIPGKILQAGLKRNIPVIAIAGCIENLDLLIKAGFSGVYQTKPDSITIKKAMEPDIAKRNIQRTVTNVLSSFINCD